MRAILFTPGDWPGIAPLNERHPAPLLPLVDRPFLQHIVEYLVHLGVRKFDVVLSHQPEKFEQFLGDGKRWGCTFTFHLARDPERPYRLLRTMNYEEGEPILLGHAERLPLLPLADAKSGPTPLLFCSRPTDGAERLDWTGWALLTSDHLAGLTPDANEAGLLSHLEAVSPEGPVRRDVGRQVTFRTFDDILQAHHAVLAKNFNGLMLTGREIEPGIWLSRNVVLHPTAEIFPPVYIGEDCSIGAGVKLGPKAVVGHGCVLDTHSTVTNSVIFPGSYVGEGLELADVIVEKNRLINARHGAAVTITDNFILGSLHDDYLRRSMARTLGRIGAGIALVLLSPLFAATVLYLKLMRGGPVREWIEAVRLPAGGEETGWQTFSLLSFLTTKEARQRLPMTASRRDFFLRFLPGLWNVMRGEVSIIGVPPRSREQIKQLPRDWQVLYLSGKAGLVTETTIFCGPGATDDDRYAAETVYVASAGWRHDLRLLRGYFARVLFQFLYPPRVNADGE